MTVRRAKTLETPAIRLRRLKLEASRQRALEVRTRFLATLTAHGIPLPVPEYRFHPDRKWQFDYAWPGEKVALEVEGGVFTKGRHSRALGFVADMEKYNTAALMGWRVVRCVPDTVRLAHAPTLSGPITRDLLIAILGEPR